MKKNIIILLSLTLLTFSFSSAYSQEGIKLELDTINVKSKSIKVSEHLLGLRYSYALTGVHFSPDMNEKGVNTPLNFAILYTYYHSMWGIWPYFGLQTGVKYGQQGFTTEYNIDDMDQVLTTIEIPLTSNFKVDIGKYMRVMIHLGAYAGYRLSTTKPGGFDCFDKRLDYGILGGGGFALKFHPFEFHIEASYQYSLSMLYYPEKFSSTWWVYSYAHLLSFSFGIHYNFD
jgi:hypothetical protein